MIMSTQCTSVLQRQLKYKTVMLECMCVSIVQYSMIRQPWHHPNQLTSYPKAQNLHQLTSMNLVFTHTGATSLFSFPKAESHQSSRSLRTLLLYIINKQINKNSAYILHIHIYIRSQKIFQFNCCCETSKLWKFLPLK